MKIKDKIKFGKYDWIVLDIQDDKALLLTEAMIEQRSYHNEKGDVTWADSEIRKYLNHEFYNNFTKEEQDKIVSVFNKNLDNQWYGSLGGEDTEDRVFLLSIEDVVCKYFGDSSELLYHPGKNQRYWFQRKDVNNVLRGTHYDYYRWWWWLRSPGRTNNRAVYIWDDGNIGIQGNGTYKYSGNTIHPITKDNCGGVRPALWIKL